MYVSRDISKYICTENWKGRENQRYCNVKLLISCQIHVIYYLHGLNVLKPH